MEILGGIIMLGLALVGLLAAVAAIVVLLIRLNKIRGKVVYTKLLLDNAVEAASQWRDEARKAKGAAIIDAKEYLVKEERRMRADAIAKSQAVVKGKVAEQFVPFTADFLEDFNPRDMRFLGSPIDFVIFDGLTEGDIERIIFVEVKTGRSRLSNRERQVADAIKTDCVTFMTFRAKGE